MWTALFALHCWKEKKMNHYSFASKYRCTWFRKKMEEKETSFSCHICIFILTILLCVLSLWKFNWILYKCKTKLICVKSHSKHCWSFIYQMQMPLRMEKNHIAANMNLNPEIHIKWQCENLMQRYSILTACFCRLYR